MERFCQHCGSRIEPSTAYETVTVWVSRQVIANGVPAEVIVCVTCDLFIPINDLHWYNQKQEERNDHGERRLEAAAP